MSPLSTDNYTVILLWFVSIPYRYLQCNLTLVCHHSDYSTVILHSFVTIIYRYWYCNLTLVCHHSVQISTLISYADLFPLSTDIYDVILRCFVTSLYRYLQCNLILVCHHSSLSTDIYTVMLRRFSELSTDINNVNQDVYHQSDRFCTPSCSHWYL